MTTSHSSHQPHNRFAWVAAAPFRSHVRHVMAAADVPWQAIAYRAGVPRGVVHTLLFGRDGRLRPRLPPSAAQRLLSVRARDFDQLRSREVPAAMVTGTVVALTAHLGRRQVAQVARVELRKLDMLMAGVGSCSGFTQMLLTVCLQEYELVSPAGAQVAA